MAKVAGWAMLRILLSVRRATPDMDAFIAAGSPAPDDSSNSWVVRNGPLFSPTPFVEGGYSAHPLISTLSGDHFGPRRSGIVQRKSDRPR